jgi:hypothetical protein
LAITGGWRKFHIVITEELVVSTFVTGMIESGIWGERKGHEICLQNFKLAGKGPLASGCSCGYNQNINK